MKVDFSAVIRDLDGKAIKDQGPPPKEGEKDTRKDFTLGAACVTALLAPYQDEQNLDGATKVKRFKLAMKAQDGGEQDLSVEDVAELKKMIGKAFPPLVVGRAYEVLDPEPVAEEPKATKKKGM